MSRRLATDTAPILIAGQKYIEFTRTKTGRLQPTPAPRRIEDTPVSEVANTGSFPTAGTPIGDRLETGGVAIESPAIPGVPEKIAEDEMQRMDELQSWWEREAQRDADACLSKLIEYGSSDFDIMAHSMLAVGGAIWSGVPDEERMRVGREMAIGFYLQGKVARAFGAFEHGRMPSNDTIDDIVRYGMMWKRVRQTGAWK